SFTSVSSSSCRSALRHMPRPIEGSFPTTAHLMYPPHRRRKVGPPEMHPVELVIRGRRVATEHGVEPASVHITRSYISSISIYEDVPSGADVIEAFDSTVMPGLVDTHVHVNEPGRTQWEGFESATRAAAAGGVTTIVDMPLNSIPATTTLDGLKE